ncbi:MAG TPA: hypothetical protein VHW03_10035 [Chthoniobacterales bacterium]|jgi:hypothetical protein|nr:hypothetical protein [Chthoniobacterales bacterium]
MTEPPGKRKGTAPGSNGAETKNALDHSMSLGVRRSASASAAPRVNAKESLRAWEEFGRGRRTRGRERGYAAR